MAEAPRGARHVWPAGVRSKRLAAPASAGSPQPAPPALRSLCWAGCRTGWQAFLRLSWQRPALPLATALLGLSLLRLASLEAFFRDHLGCRLCLSMQALPHEVQWLSLLGALHALARAVRPTGLRCLLRALLAGLVLLNAIDLLVLLQFHTRLSWQHLQTFAREGAALVAQLRVMSSQGPQAAAVAWMVAMSGLGLGVVLGRYVAHAGPGARHPWRRTGLCLLAATLAWPLQQRNYHQPYVQHLGAVLSRQATEQRAYSPAFRQALQQLPRSQPACFNGLGARPDVVLVVVESLSMFHSALFSGLNDWTPALDAWARHGRALPQFHANGVTTEQGLIALLTGEPPLPRVVDGARNAYEQFARPVHSVPHLLNGLGYHTAFLTTGNLGFMDKRPWLQGLGFQQVEGHEAPFYRGMKRYNFDAAVDDALYARAWQVLHDGRDQPRFMLLETVTTHAPFVDPDTGALSQERVVRRADRALGHFIGWLQHSGFFERGVLLVTSDHRGMVPMAPAERALLGDRGFARVPFVALGLGQTAQAGPGGAAFSQTDLLPSLRHWLGRGRHCVGPDQGIFLPTQVHSPHCVHTRRSYSDRDAFVACGANDHVARLDGDDTRWIAATGAPAPGHVLPALNRLRAGLGW